MGHVDLGRRTKKFLTVNIENETPTSSHSRPVQTKPTKNKCVRLPSFSNNPHSKNRKNLHADKKRANL